MAARRVKQSGSNRPEAVRLRNTLDAPQRVSATDPLRLRREDLDERIRELRRASRSSLVEVIG